MAEVLAVTAMANEKQHPGWRVRLTQRVCEAGRPNHELDIMIHHLAEGFE